VVTPTTRRVHKYSTGRSKVERAARNPPARHAREMGASALTPLGACMVQQRSNVPTALRSVPPSCNRQVEFQALLDGPLRRGGGRGGGGKTSLIQRRLFHDPQELLLVNLAVAVAVRLVNHLLQLLVGHVLAQLLGHPLEVLEGDLARLVVVE